jgi:hypothetical protein
MFIDWAELHWEPTQILTPPQWIAIFKHLENHPEGITRYKSRDHWPSEYTLVNAISKHYTI